MVAAIGGAVRAVASSPIAGAGARTTSTSAMSPSLTSSTSAPTTARDSASPACVIVAAPIGIQSTIAARVTG